MFYYRPYNAISEVRCWVAWRLSRGTVRSMMGGIHMPANKHHYGAESRTVWYLDMQHRLARLDPVERRILVLAGLGHSQACIAEEIGFSLRTVVRLFAEATQALERLDLRDKARVLKMLPHPREAEVAGWMQEPRCQCWRKFQGPRNKRGRLQLAAGWGREL